MKNNKLTTVETICFLSLLSINGIILSTSQIIINSCSTSSILNCIFVSILALFIVLIYSWLFKKFPDKNILDISNYLAGRILKFIVGILFIGYFTFRTIIFLRKISNCLQIVYYPMTNIIFIIALFCISALIVCNFKNNSSFKTCTLIAPIIFVTIILIFIGNFKNFDFNNIFPILGKGINNTFISGINSLFTFSSLAYLFFFPSKIENKNKFTKIAVLSILISSIFLLFSVANILLLFSHTLSNSELFPLYISVRYIEFGSFFQRLDSVFLFLCTLSFTCVFGVNLSIICDIFRDILNLSNDKPLSFSYILIVFSLTLLIGQTSVLSTLENQIYKIVFFIFSIFLPLLILISAIIKLNLSKTRKENQLI